ncbi:ATP-binding protein [Actinomadura rubrisoli]|uniref:Tetratricopeptide repeat protein n=1 Tax=Actinomadura rubrisoli TaxID=2530368 RepID=A0A4V2YWM6_9ACTN|nr:tetratricopeptide repeat protein [Actinomadura rubrisoli]TDD86077.1 tetratricopeptide repeat protein [Actinomadura rubrisoli]
MPNGTSGSGTRPAGDAGGSGEREDTWRGGRGRLAAPWIIGVLATVITGVTSSMEALDLPAPAQLAVTGGVAVLAGVAAWASTQPSGGEQPGEQAEIAGVTPAQLPPVIAHFTGRDESLAELRRAVADGSGSPASPLVVSLHGPAGVGKSALSARFAHEIADGYPDGRLYFDLRGAGDTHVRPEEVLIGFLQALGVRLATDPGGLPELQKLWWTWTRGRRLLVLLDNARDTDQVRALLPPVGGCAVLVTSRQPLHLRNTFDRRLREFTAAHAVELLGRLAGQERIDREPGTAAEIAELCGHLPLAVGICGGRLAARESWTLRAMADRLRDERRRRLDELETARDIDTSVRASLALSYDDCSRTQRRLLRTLGLLAAVDVQGWAAGALLGVSDVEGDDQLEALVDAQLVECSGTDATDRMRYRLHDLVRLYARERAEREDSADERDAAIERVLDGYRERAEQVAARRWPQDWHRGSGQVPRPEYSAVDWLSSERLAVLALLDQGAQRQMWGLVWCLGRASCSLFHSLRVFWPEWRTAAELTHTAAVHLGDDRSLGIALLERSSVEGNQGRMDRAHTDASEALRLFTSGRETWWRARALRAVGMSLRDAGNLDQGQRYLIESIEAFQDEGDAWWRARTQRNLAELRLAQRRYEEARGLLEHALEVFQRNGNRYSEAQTLRALGEVLAAEARNLRASGDTAAADVKYSLAAPALERAAEAFRLRGEQWEEARCQRAAGEVGDPRNGLRELMFVKHAEETLEALGDTWGLARTRISEGRALGRLARHAEAAGALRQAVAAFDELGDRWWQARSRRTLAEVLLDGGNREEAVAPAREALELYRRLGNAAGVTRAQAVLDRTAEPPPDPQD